MGDRGQQVQTSGRKEKNRKMLGKKFPHMPYVYRKLL